MSRNAHRFLDFFDTAHCATALDAANRFSLFSGWGVLSGSTEAAMNVFLLLNERTCGRKHAPHMNPH